MAPSIRYPNLSEKFQLDIETDKADKSGSIYGVSVVKERTVINLITNKLVLIPP